MGYGISLVRGKSRAKINAKFGNIPKGGNYRMGDEDEAVTEADLSFHITYNYSWYLYETIDKEKGVRAIYGMKGKDARKLLEAAIPKLNDMIEQETKTGKILDKTGNRADRCSPWSTNYWDGNAKNAKKAVEGLIDLCLIAPTFTFEGD